MNHDNIVDMQVKYIKTKCTELQERVGQGGQGSSILLPFFIVATAIFCNRCRHEWSFSLRLLSNGSQCISVQTCQRVGGGGVASNMQRNISL